jgi:HK97 family phage prohead protease
MTDDLTIQRAERPPLEGLRREAPFQLRAAGDGDEAGDGLTLDGYAAVFNRETIIDSWEGRFKEKIAPGAMKKSFRENPPKVQFDHGHHPLIGSIPIASVETIREDTDPVLAPEGGAHIVARLFDNWLVQPVRDAIAAESIDGMSFRFGVVREVWHDHEGKKITDPQDLRDLLRRSWLEELEDDELIVRTLQELRVPELGPVVWPAYADTSVGVRSITIDLARLDDPEQRTKLAQAVILADRAEGDDSPQITDPAEDDVLDEAPADEHENEPDVTPPITDDPSAETHEPAVPTPGRSAIQVGVLDKLRAVRLSLSTAKELSDD